MIDKIKKLQKIIEIGRLFSGSGYLIETGWWNSYKNKLPVDSLNQPIPWVTYSFIDFISERLDRVNSIFEFGSGNSTLFYEDRVKQVVSVEHDENWHSQMKNKVKDNVKLLFKSLDYDGDYCRTAKAETGAFDMIIVDGRDRVNCMLHAVDCLSSSGVIVLDDSEREAYQKGVTFLRSQSFHKLDFWGMAPGVTFKKCTSVFYKPNNCLDI